MISDWIGRLAQCGATTNEQASITAAYLASASEVQSSLDTLIAGISAGELQIMLTNWRTNGGPFGPGLVGGALPFGTHAALLSGNSADDAYAVSFGTGTRLSVSDAPTAPTVIWGGNAASTFDAQIWGGNAATTFGVNSNGINGGVGNL